MSLRTGKELAEVNLTLACFGRVLGSVYRAIATHLIKKAGLTWATAETGAVTLIQRFGSALNLNIHFHMLFLNGVYISAQGGPCFRRVKPPTSAEMEKLIHRISHRVGRYLERAGLLVQDMEDSYLTLEARDGSAMDDLIGHSMACMDARMPRAQDAQERPETSCSSCRVLYFRFTIGNISFFK